MNPAALKTNLARPAQGRHDHRQHRRLQRAHAAEGRTTPASPLEDGSLADYHLHEVALTSMTVEALQRDRGDHVARGRALEELLRPRADVVALPPADRGDDRSSSRTSSAKRPSIAEANTRAFKAGWNYGETSEDFAVSYEVAPAKLTPGTYRQITGNTALSLGLVAASKLSGLDSSSAPIRSRPPRRSSRSSRRARSSASSPSRPRTRSRRSARRSGAAFGGALGVTASVGPRDRAQGRDDRARRLARAAARRSSTSSAPARRRGCRPSRSRPTC